MLLVCYNGNICINALNNNMHVLIAACRDLQCGHCELRQTSWSMRESCGASWRIHPTSPYERWVLRSPPGTADMFSTHCHDTLTLKFAAPTFSPTRTSEC